MDDRPAEKNLSDKTFSAPPWRFRQSIPAETFDIQTKENFTPPKDLDHVIPATKPIEKKKNLPTRIFILLIYIVILTGLAISSVFLYKLINNPLKTLSMAFKQLEATSSFSLKTELDKNLTDNYKTGNLTFDIDYHKLSPRYSRARLSAEGLGGKNGDDITLFFIFNKEESFFSAQYSRLAEFENQISQDNPEIAALASYQMILPVFKGEKWLYMKSQAEAGGLSVETGKERKLNEKFLKALIVKSYDKNYELGGSKYQRIVLGFDKKALLEFTESLKTLSFDIPLKDINALIRIVDSIPSLNQDLIVFLIEKKSGNLHSIGISIPAIPKDVLVGGVVEKGGKNASLENFSKLILEKISDSLAKKEGSTIKVADVTFSNLGSVPFVQRPPDTIEGE